MPAAEGAGAAPKGSAPKTSGAAGAASRDVEKVDHTSAPGEPAPHLSLLKHKMYLFDRADNSLQVCMIQGMKGVAVRASCCCHVCSHTKVISCPYPANNPADNPAKDAHGITTTS